jgi:hypothetical protein
MAKVMFETVVGGRDILASLWRTSFRSVGSSMPLTLPEMLARKRLLN